MPAPRTCRSCGATIPAHGEWCTQCFEPVRWFSARPNLDPPQPPPEPRKRFRLVPAVERGDGGHYSRWDKGPTTFAPFGRVAITVVVGLWLMWGLFATFFIMAACMFVVGGKVLADVWRREWVVPGERTPEPRPPTPSGSGFRVPQPEERLDPVTPPVPASTRVAWVAIAVLMIGTVVAYANGSEGIRNVVMFTGLVTTSVLLMVWLIKA